MKKILSVLIFAFLLISGSRFTTLAQQTAAYRQPEADYRMGLELFRQQKFGAAQQKFEKVLKSISNTEDALRIDAEYHAAFCALELLNPDAEYRLVQFVKDHPNNNNTKLAHFQLGKFYYSQKDFDKAIEAFEKVEIYELNNSNLAEFYFKTGFCYFKKDELEKASKNFFEIKDSDSKYSAPALYYYSHIAYLQGNYEKALAGFQKLANDETFKNMVPLYIIQIQYIKGDYEELLKTALPLLENSKTKKMPDIARLVGESYFKTGKYAEAIPYLELYSDRTTQKVSRPEIYQLSYSYYKTKEYAKAIPLFQEIANEDDSLTQNSLYLLADCYLKTNQKQFARNTFSSAAKMSQYKEIKEDALYNYAKLSYELAKNPFNEAINSIKQYLSDYPQSSKTDEMYAYLVNLFLSSNNYKDALISLDNIKVRDEKLKEAYQNVTYNRGVELFNENNIEEAIALFKKSLNHNIDKKTTAYTRYWLGESYYRLNDYDQSLSNYRSFMLLPTAYKIDIYNTANYNIAYIYFKKKNYKDAAISFRKFLSNKDNEDPKIVADAYLRTADCYFIEKQYADAIENYDKAINAKSADADYALYQKAMAQGAQGSTAKKMATLSDLVKNYKKSAYYDDALYESGITALMQNNSEQAMIHFKKIISETPKSSYAIKAKLKTGMIYYNNNQNELALQTLQNLTNTYPNSPEAREALVTIKNIYIDMNKVDDYFAYAKKLPFANINSSEEDSATYIAAENLYMKGDCEGSSRSFGNYLNKFPFGSFTVNAAFYKAECDNKAEKFSEALKNYQYVVSQPVSRFTESALVNTAKINLNDKNYQEACNAYKRLSESAEYKANLTDATSGLMRCYYSLEKYDSAIIYAQRLLTNEKLSTGLQAEAQLIIGKSAYAMKDFPVAKTAFESAVNLSQGTIGAEAKYNLVLLEYEGADYSSAEKSIFALSDSYASCDFWVAKGFILLGDVYVKTGNIFQAKQTLQSIIDNYDGDDLKQIAKDKLNQIIQNEKQQ